MTYLMLVLAAGSIAAPVHGGGEQSTLRVTLTPGSVVGGNNVSGEVELSAPATASFMVTLLSTATGIASFVDPALGQASAVSSLNVPMLAGSSRAPFQVRTFGVAARSIATIVASAGTSTGAANLTVDPAAPRSLTVSPGSIVGGTSAVATIMLDGLAPSPQGATVALVLTEASRPALGDGSLRGLVSATIPPSVVVQANTRTATFNVTTVPTATARTFQIATAASGTALGNFTVLPPSISALQLTPGAFGGRPVSATVVLNGAAPGGGQNVALTSSNTQVALPPATVAVPAGRDRITFSFTPAAVGQLASVTIGAAPAGSNSSGGIVDGSSNTFVVGTASAALTVFPIPQLRSITVTPSPVIGGEAITLALDVAVSTGASQVAAPSALAHITVDNPGLVSLPATVTIPGHQLLPRAIIVAGTTSSPTGNPNVATPVVITVTLEGSTASTTIPLRRR